LATIISSIKLIKMKKNFKVFTQLKWLLFSGIFLMAINGCKKHDIPVVLNGYQQTNLVSDVDSFGAARIDPTLVNPWGISFSATSPLWISANHTSLSVIYDKDGNTVIPNVTIENGNGAPTGQVFNGTSAFIIPETGKPARFIFCGENGTIDAWNGGTSAIRVADRSGNNAVYKGMVMANDGTGNFLYVANFKKGKIDVFDSTFKFVTNKLFVDHSIPDDFGPFNIRNINGNLYVTYAKHQGPDNEDDKKGPGNGYVDIFNTKGELLSRFASKGALNSPWGIVAATPGFSPYKNAILIGNFGDGRINLFSENGDLIGALKDVTGHDIIIDGLWALENNIHNANPDNLYFTAGPADETHGLFGYISKK
jgi:uncharacterized protein (TIGR03118 family)